MKWVGHLKERRLCNFIPEEYFVLPKSTAGTTGFKAEEFQYYYLIMTSVRIMQPAQPACETVRYVTGS
jgi:hypothetical protein